MGKYKKYLLTFFKNNIYNFIISFQVSNIIYIKKITQWYDEKFYDIHRVFNDSILITPLNLLKKTNKKEYKIHNS
jgi:hypothetical protein